MRVHRDGFTPFNTSSASATGRFLHLIQSGYLRLDSFSYLIRNDHISLW